MVHTERRGFEIDHPRPVANRIVRDLARHRGAVPPRKINVRCGVDGSADLRYGSDWNTEALQVLPSDAPQHRAIERHLTAWSQARPREARKKQGQPDDGGGHQPPVAPLPSTEMNRQRAGVIGRFDRTSRSDRERSIQLRDRLKTLLRALLEASENG